MNDGERTVMGLVLAEKILLNMEKVNQTDWNVFLDQSKVFDTANQPLMKLNDLTDALYIMQSYLSSWSA